MLPAKDKIKIRSLKYVSTECVSLLHHYKKVKNWKSNHRKSGRDHCLLFLIFGLMGSFYWLSMNHNFSICFEKFVFVIFKYYITKIATFPLLLTNIEFLSNIFSICIEMITFFSLLPYHYDQIMLIDFKILEIFYQSGYPRLCCSNKIPSISMIWNRISHTYRYIQFDLGASSLSGVILCQVDVYQHHWPLPTICC